MALVGQPNEENTKLHSPKAGAPSFKFPIGGGGGPGGPGGGGGIAIFKLDFLCGVKKKNRKIAVKHYFMDFYVI